MRDSAQLVQLPQPTIVVVGELFRPLHVVHIEADVLVELVEIIGREFCDRGIADVQNAVDVEQLVEQRLYGIKIDGHRDAVQVIGTIVYIEHGVREIDAYHPLLQFVVDVVEHNVGLALQAQEHSRSIDADGMVSCCQIII